MAAKKQINEFINRIAPIAQAQAANREKWSLPSVCIAQCCCESGYGTSPKMIAANAILGIKVGKSKVHFGTAWRDKAYSTRTKECYDGRTYVNITDMFRAYDCIEDAIEDYYDMLSVCSRYKGCLNQIDPKICITAIKSGGYATDPAYIDTIMSIVTKYGLTQYDNIVSKGGIMGVRIGHASISEKGTVNGIKGDQTQKEVCIRSWFSKPWDYMAIYPNPEVRERHAKAIEDACANDNIGYGQGDRNTLNTLAKAVEYDLTKVGKCNCDCSSLQNVAAIVSGVPGVTYDSNGWTTATMKAALQKLGYKIITDAAYLKTEAYSVRGAIYVKASGHTVCGLDNGTCYKKTLEKAGLVSDLSDRNKNDNPYTEPNANLKRGTRGEGARWVQWCLWRFGLLDESGIDGVIGPKSEAVIRTAQERLGLAVDGIVGQNTRQKFNQVLGISFR